MMELANLPACKQHFEQGSGTLNPVVGEDGSRKRRLLQGAELHQAIAAQASSHRLQNV